MTLLKHVALILFSSSAAIALAEVPALPTKHEERKIEGWTVRVDSRLLAGENQKIGARAVNLLDAKLTDIVAIVPQAALEKLQKVVIQLDLDHGKLQSMQYHPSRAWLVENGYSAQLEKCVHIPQASDLLDPKENVRMPLVILHELAHAYHDQVLGFEEKRVLDAWKKFCDSGNYEAVLNNSGQKHRHYGLTDQKEFFSEMTEAYFGANDFYPFSPGELKQAEPEVHKLMQAIWGEVK
jgi:hypothetical protein